MEKQQALTCKLVVCDHMLYLVSKRQPQKGDFIYDTFIENVTKFTGDFPPSPVEALKVEATNNKKLGLPWRIQDAFGDTINFNPGAEYYYNLLMDEDGNFCGERFGNLCIEASDMEQIKNFCNASGS